MLEAPITTDELRQEIKKGKRRKAPGMDGISQDFFREAWDVIHADMLTIIQTMHNEGVLMETQKLGMIVCIPKVPAPSIPEEYSFLTMLNADMKLLTRIVANRMNMWLPDILHPSQHCGIRGKTIFDAVATIRDVIAHAEYYRRAICIVSLDFTPAFDRVSHQYLFHILHRCGFGVKLQQRIRSLYDGAKAMLSINGHISAAMPIRCGVRQGFPLRMILFVLALNPFLSMLASTLPGVKIGLQGTRTATVAYADDVTVFLTSPRDVEILQDAISRYEQASGARVNVRKSTALAIGGWNTSLNICNIPYRNEVMILGVRFTDTLHGSEEITWTPIVHSIQAQAKEAYVRNLNLASQIQYIHNYLFARVWFAAQILPITANCIRQIRTAVTWFLWRGSIFRLAYATMQRSKQEGGWNLMDVEAKSRALLHCRLTMQSREMDTITADWPRRWSPATSRNNPPDLRWIPLTLHYIRQYTMDCAYIMPSGAGETM
jgi:hypothetical protein